MYFYQLAWAMGPEPIISTARSLGVGRPTGIDLPGEAPGRIAVRFDGAREDYTFTVVSVDPALLRMVDYTQWYTLTVERRDETGRWMPLTRRLYGQGSGGRRTLDLLLTALVMAPR